MKRALMTFGNPFGLALYDKTQANVADPPPPEPDARAVSMSKVAIDLAKTTEALEKWSRDNKAQLDAFDPPTLAAVRSLYANRLHDLKTAKAAAPVTEDA